MPRDPDKLVPKDHAEAIALFRSQVIGTLVRRDLSRGELRCALIALTKEQLRPPGAERTRRFSIATLERWYYRYKKRGVAGLVSRARKDSGRARELTAAQRELLLDIRREHPSASVPVIMRTLVLDGRVGKDTISDATVRRLYREQGLDRAAIEGGAGRKTRLRWQAERPGAMWQGDVCYGPSLLIDGKREPLRIHALLDDASRFVVALEAHHQEREVDMLGLFVAALRRHGAPDALYLDNGSTYRGEILRVACERLGVTLLHPRPGDAPARGKIERFWRTLRGQCLDFLGSMTSLHDVQVRLGAFLDEHYHSAPHAALMGRSPSSVWLPSEPERKVDTITEELLRTALTVRERRRVRKDTTVEVDGTTWELDQGFLAGRIVTIGRSLVHLGDPPWIEHDGKRLPLFPVDAVKNGHRARAPRRPDEPATAAPPVLFDPAGALLDRAAGRRPRHGNKDRS